MNQQNKKLFLFLNQDTETQVEIIKEITSNRFCAIETVDTIQRALEKSARGDVDCLIANLKKCDGQVVESLLKIKALPHPPQVVVFATEVTEDGLRAAIVSKKLTVMEKPFKGKEVQSVCRKIVNEQSISQREFKRFSTNQTAILEKLSGNQKYTGRLFNLSKGGAYVELDDGKLNEGEIYKVTVKLNEVSKERMLFGKVVWAIKGGGGLRFVREDEAYTMMLEKL